MQNSNGLIWGDFWGNFGEIFEQFLTILNPFLKNFRTATARGKAEQADIAAIHAREDSQMSVGVSQEFGTIPVSDQVAAVNAAFGLGNSAAAVAGHAADVIDHAGLSGNGIASNPG